MDCTQEPRGLRARFRRLAERSIAFRYNILQIHPTKPAARSCCSQKGKPLQNNVDIAALFNRHAATVYRLCYSFLGSAADAEDATQSVFMKLIDRPRRFNDPEHEKAWLIVCAQNHCRDVLKSAHRTRQTALPEDIADERRARQDETLDAVLALPEKYKTCVYLFYYEGYRTAEIAALTGVPSSTVRSHLSEARALLKTMLGGERHGR